MSTVPVPAGSPVPMWLVAELTYRCPLHCPFCSNPVDFAQASAELTTAEWFRVLAEAREMGAVQLGFSGGEPLGRPDLEELVAEASRLGFYTNLITSGVGLNEKRIGALKQAGLDHIQLSFQDSSRELNDFLSSTRTFELKRRVATLIRSHGFPMVMNCVLHRLNIDHVDRIIDMALDIGVEFLELANTQYYGWALANRSALLPSREQLENAEKVTRAFRERLRDRTDVIYVIPDYYSRYPKPCMGGWGDRQLVIGPEGNAWPCLSAHELPLPKANVREHPLDWIWRSSPMFTAFRGTDWMADPCRSCERREVDLGGCRCQAFQLTGDMTRTDPVCVLSPDRHIIDEAVAAANDPAAEPVGAVPVGSGPVGLGMPELAVRPHRAD